MTLEQAIDELMDASRSIAEVAESESDEANRINAQNVSDDCKQLAAWLRELVERRKAPEIIYCKDCTRRRKNTETGEYYCRASGLRNAGHDFCSGGKRPERRTDDSQH